MYARVSSWKGFDAESLKAMTEMINSAEGPPPGVPSQGIMVLNNVEAGTSVSIVMFNSEEDMRTGHAALSAMDRPEGAPGEITGIEMYEVAVDVRM